MHMLVSEYTQSKTKIKNHAGNEPNQRSLKFYSTRTSMVPAEPTRDMADSSSSRTD